MSKTAKQTVRKTGKTLARADRAVTHAAARGRHTAPARLAGFLGEVGDQPQLVTASVGTIVAGLIGRRPDLVRGGARMLAAHFVATAAKSAIKHSIDRTRPGKALDDGHRRFAPGHSHDHAQNSFPSGHTAGAVAVARAASREIDGIAGPAALAAGAVAAVQAPAGHHYLSDVIVGGAIGWAAELLVDRLIDRLLPSGTIPADPNRAIVPKAT